MLLNLLFASYCHSQNLVPNYSFEDGDCPNNFGELELADNWINPTSSSPDYFNPCTLDPRLRTPSNNAGYQTAKTGVSYGFIVTYSTAPGQSNDFREYVQVQLNYPLDTSGVYCLTFYVSLAEVSDFANNSIGGFFSAFQPDSSSYNYYGVLPYLPQVQNSPFNVLNSKTDWMKVQGTFVAKGGEKFLTIGNFFDNDHSDTSFVGGGSFIPKSAYYIDDISLYPIYIPIKDTVVCPNTPVTIGRAPISGCTYSWNFDPTLNDLTVSNPTINTSTNKEYVLTVTSPEGCTYTDTIKVTVLSLNAGRDTSICLGDSINIGDANNPSGVYTWNPSDFINGSPDSILFVRPLDSTLYQLSANINGCILTDEVKIDVKPKPVITAYAGNDTMICDGIGVQLGQAPESGYNYEWTPVTGLNDPTSSNPIATPATDVGYALIVTSNKECSSPAIDSVYITVCKPENPTIPDFFIPNVFTPNGDGINDVWIIMNLPPESEISIYNRWGELIKKQTIPHWDGRTDAGIEAPGGVYFYLINTGTDTFTGSFHLSR